MFTWIKLRWRQAFLTRDAKRIGIYELRWSDAIERLASPWHGGGPKELKGNSLAFPGYFLEGLAWGKLEGLVLGNRARLPNPDVAMHFCFAFVPCETLSTARHPGA